MEIKSQRAAYRKGVTSKLIDGEKASASVTDVTLAIPETPHKSYERLKPWLQLTNLLGPPTEMPDPDVPNAKIRVFPLEHFEFFRRFDASGLSKAREFENLTSSSDEETRDRLWRLAHQVARNLHFFSGVAERCHYFEDSEFLGQDKEYGLCIETIDSAAASVSVRQGTFHTRISFPYKEFLDALARAEPGRLRCCPICKKIFYALRRTQKTCSKPCNQNRRVREWRVKQSEYEYNRKLRPAGAEPVRRIKR
jgi:hypothetical protein